MEPLSDLLLEEYGSDLLGQEENPTIESIFGRYTEPDPLGDLHPLSRVWLEQKATQTERNGILDAAFQAVDQGISLDEYRSAMADAQRDLAEVRASLKAASRLQRPARMDPLELQEWRASEDDLGVGAVAGLLGMNTRFGADISAAPYHSGIRRAQFENQNAIAEQRANLALSNSEFAADRAIADDELGRLRTRGQLANQAANRAAIQQDRATRAAANSSANGAIWKRYERTNGYEEMMELGTAAGLSPDEIRQDFSDRNLRDVRSWEEAVRLAAPAGLSESEIWDFAGPRLEELARRQWRDTLADANRAKLSPDKIAERREAILRRYAVDSEVIPYSAPLTPQEVEEEERQRDESRFGPEIQAARQVRETEIQSALGHLVKQHRSEKGRSPNAQERESLGWRAREIAHTSQMGTFEYSRKNRLRPPDVLDALSRAEVRDYRRKLAGRNR